MPISVIIPCFNAAAFLPNAVASIVRQGVPETEIIVVDDASADHTVTVAQQLAEKIGNVRVIRRALNEGPGRCRNIGLREARGPYVCFLDADDAYSDGVFAAALGALDSDPTLHAVEFAIRLVNCHREVSSSELDAMAAASSCNIVVRRDFAILLGGFPTGPEFRTEVGGEDAAFRAALRTWGKVRRIIDVFLEYTVCRGSHFDRCMDMFARIGPLEPWHAQAIALREREQWVAKRMLHARRVTKPAPRAARR